MVGEAEEELEESLVYQFELLQLEDREIKLSSVCDFAVFFIL
jgi:hypothetical protein